MALVAGSYPVVLSSLSTEMVQVPINARLGGSPNYNPTADMVQLAFMAGTSKPGTSDWNAGTWATDPGPEYLAQCLVGPNTGVVLPVGTYAIWVKVTDSPEVPVLQAGQLVIE